MDDLDIIMKALQEEANEIKSRGPTWLFDPERLRLRIKILKKKQDHTRQKEMLDTAFDVEESYWGMED